MRTTVGELWDKAMIAARGTMRVEIARLLESADTDIKETSAEHENPTNSETMLRDGFKAACHRIIGDALGGQLGHKDALAKLTGLLKTHASINLKGKGKKPPEEVEGNLAEEEEEEGDMAESDGMGGVKKMLSKDGSGNGPYGYKGDRPIGNEGAARVKPNPASDTPTIVTKPKAGDTGARDTMESEAMGKPSGPKQTADGFHKSKQSMRMAESRQLDTYRRMDQVAELCEALEYRPDALELRAMAALSDAEVRDFVKKQKNRPHGAARRHEDGAGTVTGMATGAKALADAIKRG